MCLAVSSAKAVLRFTPHCWHAPAVKSSLPCRRGGRDNLPNLSPTRSSLPTQLLTTQYPLLPNVAECSGRDKLTNVSPTSDTPTPVLQVTVLNIGVSLLPDALLFRVQLSLDGRSVPDMTCCNLHWSSSNLC